MIRTHLTRTILHPSTSAVNVLARSPLVAFQHRCLHSTGQSSGQQQQQPHQSHEQGQRNYQPHPADTLKLFNNKLDAETSRRHEDWVLSHPVYTKEELEAVKVVHAERKTMSDKFVSWLVSAARWGFDFVTRYKELTPAQRAAKIKELGKPETELTVAEKREAGLIMTLDGWMARILFLESIAGVPGMVAATLRHLRSLRRMERDRGFINSLLQEAENERMHLQTFIKIKEAGKFMRLIIIAAQGVFYNVFFLSYMISPRIAHRFVGFLEEEACHTYTQIVDDIRAGNIPEWGPDGAQKVPAIARDYWRLGDDATMLDLILAVRADESHHRLLNNTMAELEPDAFNPFAVKHAPAKMAGELPGLTREQGLEWLRQVEREIAEKMERSPGHQLDSPDNHKPSKSA